ncbi:MAG: hypothetical protein HY017_04850 [Betaproteobacteria bacterium]|nr:hypothetical protein [Betaproteobacteria bacterium]
MPTDPAQTYTDLLALEGVALEPARAAGVAELLQLQLETERKATQLIAFEAEPSGFARTLREGAK